MPVKAGPDPWRLRKCKCCKCSYRPSCKERHNAEKSLFCTRKCKDTYYRSGGMNIEKLRELLARQIIKQLLADEKFLQAMADKLRVSDAIGRAYPDDSPSAERILTLAERFPRAY